MQPLRADSGPIEILSGCITGSSSLYNIQADASLYDAAQTIRLTVVLQKGTWTGDWEDVFVFSAGGAGAAHITHEMRLSSGVYRAKVMADVYAPGGRLTDSSILYTAVCKAP